MVCGMKGTTRQPSDPEPRPPLGLIHTDDLPLVYKKALEHKNESYEVVLEKCIGFNNPNNIVYLSNALGIDGYNTLMPGLSERFPQNEYASELRQAQASKWAYRNVADGIDYFKAGKHTEAFLCLNKALTIDPRNVEGLVARGALFANNGNFQKAIDDFETALKLNPSHANARKYMGETLVALGRSYEDENKLEEARKAYQSCLSIMPYHEEAQNSLEFLKNKTQQSVAKNLFEPDNLLLSANKTADVHDAFKHLLKKDEGEKKDKKKKKKSKKRKSRRRSSSSSSSSSSGSNDSSSSSSSSNSDSSSSSGDSDFKKHKKQHKSRSHRHEKQSSLSPLSKRMAMMDPSHDTPTNYQFNQPAAATSSSFGFQPPSPGLSSSKHDVGGGAATYEQQVKAFLEKTKNDSDYEEKVRKFIEQTSKWKKGKSDEKKKKKRKEKKSKKESKKRKEKKSKRKGFDLSDCKELLENKRLREVLKKELGFKEKKSKKHALTSDDEEYLLKSGYSKRFLENLPDLEELESKLSAYYSTERKESKKHSDDEESPKPTLYSPSPTREQKAQQVVAEATASVSGMGAKWKMQVGTSVAGGSRFKKRPEGEWTGETKTFVSSKNEETFERDMLHPNESNGGVRKVSVMKESTQKQHEPPPLPPPQSSKELVSEGVVQKAKGLPVAPTTNPMIAPGQVVLDKFGNFRLVTPEENKKQAGGEQSMSRRTSSPPKAYGGGRSKPPEPPGRPRSRSRSTRRHSRSRSRGRSRSSTSRSRSDRSRSRSYDSRSRSRSGSYYSRSRSRSRSYSVDRRRYRRGGGGFRGRFNDNRGTYYRPRYQNARGNPRGRGGGGGYYNRDQRYNDRDFRGGRGRPYGNYGRGGRRPWGRFQRGGGGYRDFRDRRSDRSHSRDRSRSYTRSKEREPEKFDEDKDKINKYGDVGNEEPVKHEGPLSEGEDRDDFVDKEARKSDDGERSAKAEEGLGNDIPSETNIEEMDKFLSKVKKDKKEEMLERNKDLLKSKPW